MGTRIRRGHISEFVLLVADAFGTDESSAESATRTMLVRLALLSPESGLGCLFDNVPGARDLAFAGMLLDPDVSALLDPNGVNKPMLGPSGLSGRVAPDLFVFYLAYCATHGGVDCAPRIIAAARPFLQSNQMS
jgi:hypothetical protein